MNKHLSCETLKALLFIVALSFNSINVLAENHDINRLSIRESTLGDPNGDSNAASISGDGKLVVFSSEASNIDPNDGDTHTDIFLVNRNTPTPVPARISVDKAGADTNGENDQANISYNGNTIVFRSSSTDLITGPSLHTTPQVFLYNISSTPTPRPTPVATVGAYALISVNSSGTPGNGTSYSPKTSNSGDYVVFASDATNLTSNCTSSTNSQIYLFDASSATTPLTCISTNSSGNGANGDSYSPGISKDGAYVVFESSATNLTSTNTAGLKNIYLYHANPTPITLVSSDSNGNVANGDSSNPAINADGTYIVFQTSATDIVANCPSSSERTAIILYKIADGTKTCASITSSGSNCNGNSVRPNISGDGNTITFSSDCINLVSPEAKDTPATGAYDVYKIVRGTPTISRESSTVAQKQITPASDYSAINSDGSVVTFESGAALRTTDKNSLTDIYVTDTACLTDTDGDSTVDCADNCYADPTKTSAGTCGCGTADTDTDGDGTLDCEDECPTDSAKITEGACGCGVADVDTDSNGLTDCLEPNSSTIPDGLLITRSRPLHKITTRVFSYYANKGYTFTVQLMKGRTVIRSKRTKLSSVIFSGLDYGVYYVKYRIRTGLGTTSAWSDTQKIRFNRG